MTGRLPAAYRPGISPLHRLNPLVKGAWLVGSSVLVFAVSHPLATAGGVALGIFGFWLAGLSPRQAPGLRLLSRLSILLFAVQAVFVHDGQVVLYLLPLGPGALPVTDVGLRLGLFVAGRLLAIVLLSYLFVLTTEPNELAHALMRAGLPYRYGYALIVALRLLPVVELEASTVYQAQLARGVRYDQGGPRRFFLIARRLLFPLLASVLGRVDALAISMDGRCFGRSRTRTYLRESRFRRGDWLALGGLVALLIGGVALG